MKHQYKIIMLEVEVMTRESEAKIERLVLNALGSNIENSNIRAQVVSRKAMRMGKEVENG